MRTFGLVILCCAVFYLVKMLDNERVTYCWEDGVKLFLLPVIFPSIDIHIMQKDEATCQNNDPPLY